MNVRPSLTSRCAGVTKAAVSYALNGQPGVSAAARERIARDGPSGGWTGVLLVDLQIGDQQVLAP